MEGWAEGDLVHSKIQCLEMRVIRYFVVGGLSAAIDIGIFVVFAKILGYNYLVIGAVSFLIATLANYVLSVRHVFSSGARFSRNREIGLVYLVSLIALGINQTVLYIGVGVLGWEMLLTKLIATSSAFFWNYGMRAHFIFRH